MSSSNITLSPFAKIIRFVKYFQILLPFLFIQVTSKALELSSLLLICLILIT